MPLDISQQQNECALTYADLAAQVATLRALLADAVAVVPPEWRLTATEERIFRVLLAVDTASRRTIAEGASQAANRTIDVFVSRIRKKTAPFGVEIETVRSRGWRLVDRAARAHVAASSPQPSL